MGMTSQQDEVGGGSGRVSLVREYFGTEPRKLVYLAGFLVGVLVVVTVPYVAIVGWGKWTSNMGEASHMLWAGYTPAAGIGYPQGPDPRSPYAGLPAAMPGALPGMPGALPGMSGALPGVPGALPGVQPPAWATPTLVVPEDAITPLYALPYPMAQAVPRILPVAARQAARQYVCPSCGAVAPPSWTAVGQPVCPFCGSLMTVGRAGPDFNPAAAP